MPIKREPGESRVHDNHPPQGLPGRRRRTFDGPRVLAFISDRLIPGSVGQTLFDHYVGWSIAIAAEYLKRTLAGLVVPELQILRPRDIIIWVAEAFRAEHLAVLDQLNALAPARLRLMAVRLSVWRIGGGHPRRYRARGAPTGIRRQFKSTKAAI